MIFSITASSFALLAASALFAANFAFTSALYSSNVSNLETSCAKTSSNSGSSFTLISFTLHLNVAAHPASSGAWYSSGNVTFTSTSSPIFAPTYCSSNPGINALDPIVNG